MEPNGCLRRERANLRKMMYMWGKKQVDEVGENKEESRAKIKIRDKKNRKQKDKNSNYCKEEVTMVIRRVLGSSYKFQSRKEKQKYGQTKNDIPPWGRCKEILSEVPQKKKIKAHKRKKEDGLGNRVPKKVVVSESNSAILNNGFEDCNSDPVLHPCNFLFITKEGIQIMPDDFQGGGPAPGSSCLQVAIYILLIWNSYFCRWFVL